MNTNRIFRSTFYHMVIVKAHVKAYLYFCDNNKTK